MRLDELEGISKELADGIFSMAITWCQHLAESGLDPDKAKEEVARYLNTLSLVLVQDTQANTMEKQDD